MEAEAKDSEEEAEDTKMKQSGQKSLNRSPYNLKSGMLSSSELPNSAAEVSTSTMPRHSPNTKEVLLTPGKSHQQASFSNVNVPELRAFQYAGFRSPSFKLAEPHNRIPSLSDVKFTAMSNSSKTLGKLPAKSIYLNLSLSGEISGNICGSPQSMTIRDASDIFSSKIQQPEEIISSCFIKSPCKGSELYHQEDSIDILQQKRAMEFSSSSSKLQKMSHNAKAAIKGSALDTEQLEPTSSVADEQHINDRLVDGSGSLNVVHNTHSSHATTKSLSHDLSTFKFVTAEDRQSSIHEKSPKMSLRGYGKSTLAGNPDMHDKNAYKESHQMSFSGLGESTSGRRLDVEESGLERCLQMVGEPGELQNKQQDVEFPSLHDRKMGMENNHSPVTSDLLGGGSDKLVTKPLNKKRLAKKSLGSRTKLSNVANRKGSIYSSKIASENDSAICLNRAEERAPHKNASELETSPPTINIEAAKNMVEKIVSKSQNDTTSKKQFTDDDTGAPDGEVENDAEKTPGKQKSELVESTCKADTLLEMKHARHDSNVVHECVITSKNGTNRTDPERGADSKNSELGLKCDGMKRKSSKMKKQFSGKTKMKTVASQSKNDLDGQGTTVTKNVKEKDEEKENDTTSKNQFTDDDTEAPDEEVDAGKTHGKQKSKLVESTCKADTLLEMKYARRDSNEVRECVITSKNGKIRTDPERGSDSKNSELGLKCDGMKRKSSKRKKQLSGKAKMKTVASQSKNDLDGQDTTVAKNVEEKDEEKENFLPHPVAKMNSSNAFSEVENSVAADKSCPVGHKEIAGKPVVKSNKKAVKTNAELQKVDPNAELVQKVFNRLKTEPVCFILSGYKLQRKEFQRIIRCLKGKFCRDSHQWSYQATHFIAPEIRRTEKFFAAAASGRWILKTDYLSACYQAGKFLAEEPYEWHKNGLSEDGAINLEAPRKWRHLRERTGHGAFYGMRIIVYGECFAPPLDTLKRVVKAGDGTILATSPPYTRFLKSGVDFAVVTAGMPRADLWVQEFLKHEIPCVVADYLVEFICKPGYSLERHVLYNSHEWAEKSFTNLTSRAEETVEDLTSPAPQAPDDCESNDLTCQVCGSSERGEVMLICGDQSGSVGCGVGCHIDCCDPPFQDVPEEDWFCPKCSRRSRNNTIPSKKRKTGTSQSNAN